MIHAITLTETDHLTFQLYDASNNPLKRKSRRTTFLILLALAMLVIFWGNRTENDFMCYYGVFCTILVLCFGNMYLRWRHKKHYAKHVKQQFVGRQEETVQIEIFDDHIRTVDDIVDSHVKISEIATVIEIKDYNFVKLSNAQTLIIPKSSVSLNGEIDEMIKKHNISHVKQLEWKW